MEFKELVKNRRSCRSFETTGVSEETIAAILGAGTWAPSPLNMQPWEFLVVTDPRKKAEVRKVAEDARQRVTASGGPGWVAKYGLDFIEEAPVLIAVLFDPSQKGLGGFFGQGQGAIAAAAACVQNILLAAADLGLGTLWFTFFNPAEMRTCLGIPENLEVAGVIPLGKVKGVIKTPPRKQAKVHRETYGRAQ
ncbi:MAG: nitroreductase [Deltaproteobacteria bacterium]|nr:nitroreductase [Deltaproteobacteria bacterium]